MPALRALLRRLREGPPLALAYSGGLDSRFLAHACLLAGTPPRLLHVTGPHVAAAESRAAFAWAESRGLAVEAAVCDPLSLPEVRAGGRERCYACKRLMFEGLLRRLEGDAEGRALCDGGNASDLTAYRPGIRALRELGVRSPLAEAGLAKDDIRALARQSGLERPEQAARPCLLTRFDYGLEPRAPLLEALAGAEAAVEELFAHNGIPLPDFRLRLTAVVPGADPRAPGSYAAELHLGAPPSGELRRHMQKTLAAHGFVNISFVVSHAVSGHFDRPQGG